MTDRNLDRAREVLLPGADVPGPGSPAAPARDLRASSTDGLAASPDGDTVAGRRQDTGDGPSPGRGDPAGRPLADEAADAARDAKGRIQSRAQEVVSERKDAAAGRVTGFARALEGAASSLEENGQATEAKLTRQAAGSLARLADATQGKEVGDMLAAVEEFGRRQPVAFLTGAVIAGFALSRFLKSSTGAPGQSARPGPIGQRGGSYT